MAGVKAAAFSVTVDNEQDVRAWLADFGAQRDRVQKELDVLCALAKDTPMISLTIHYDEQGDPAQIDGCSTPEEG
jgi:hypothetical protein